MKGVRGVARGRSWKLGGASNDIVVLPRYPFHVHGLLLTPFCLVCTDFLHDIQFKALIMQCA